MQNGTFLRPHPAYELPIATDNSLLPAKGFIAQVSWNIQKGSKDWLSLTISHWHYMQNVFYRCQLLHPPDMENG